MYRNDTGLWALLLPCRRKNLGYLWAIQHGATQVYETDDDNELKLDEPPSLSNLKYYVYNASGKGFCLTV